MHTNAVAMDTKEVETALERLRREQGRLKGWLAREMGIDRWRLSKLLSGEREMTLREAQRAAAALGVGIETFLSRVEGE